MIELAIRDLKNGAGLAHCPSGRFAANAAWLLAGTLAHNLLRWIAVLGLGAQEELTAAKTIGRTLLALPGRLTRSARRWRLHLPRGWPWAHSFEMALARLRKQDRPAPRRGTGKRASRTLVRSARSRCPPPRRVSP